MSIAAPESAELVNKMTGIEDLPCELALQLAYSMPFKDFCQLRRACKRIAVCTKEDFVKYATTKPLHIFPSRLALQKLESLVQDKKVKYLVSCLGEIAIHSSINIERSKMLGLNDFYTPHKREDGAGDCSPCSKFCSYYNDRFLSQYDFRKALQVILRNLPNVSVTVHRGTSASVRAWGIHELIHEVSNDSVTIPDLTSSSHGHYVSDYIDADEITHDRISTHVIGSCGDVGISTLDICHLNPNRTPWFNDQRAAIAQRFLNLRSLTFSIFAKPHQDNGIHLARWLNLLPGLEHVTLEWSRRLPRQVEQDLLCYKAVIRDLPGRWQPHNLKSLTLESGELSENDFVGLLGGTKSKLIELELVYVWIAGREDSEIHKEAWKRIYTLLKDDFIELRCVDIVLTGRSAPYDVIAGRDDDLKAEFSRSIKALGGVDIESVGM